MGQISLAEAVGSATERHSLVNTVRYVPGEAEVFAEFLNSNLFIAQMICSTVLLHFFLQLLHFRNLVLDDANGNNLEMLCMMKKDGKSFHCIANVMILLHSMS